MSTNSQEQEIDLGQISKKIGGFFQKIIDSFFDVFLFLKRNIKIVGILFILGIGLGYILDKTTKEYNHEIIVTPNFGSVDYLYSKINLINAKRKEKDTVFLKSIGIKEPKKFLEIEISPINDVYKFIQDKGGNFELIKLMAEDGDIEKIIVNKITSKNYPYHLIKISTLKSVKKEDLIEPILNFLENSDYFAKIKKESVNNINVKIESNKQTIEQINSILNQFSNTTGTNSKSDKLIYYNENNQLNEVINSKDLLIYEQASNRIALINTDKIIKEINSTINIKNTKGTNGKMMFLLPILFILLFMSFVSIRMYYRRQLKKRNLE